MSLETIAQPTQTLKLDRKELVKLIRKWGGVNTDGLLDKNCQIFITPNIEGFIGYKTESAHAIVFGEPVCEISQRKILAKAFDEYCKYNNLKIVYTMVSEDFANFLSNEYNATLIEFGTQFILDPSNPPNQKSGSKGVLVRKKVKHALQDGVIVKEHFSGDEKIEKQMESLAKTWVEMRQGPQIYLCKVSLFNDRIGKRWFYAEHNERIVGLMVLNELQSVNGWLLNNIFMVKDAPKGLSELLIITALEVLNKENCQYVLAGPVPLDRLEIKGMGTIKERVIRLIFKIISLFFNLGGHTKFWEKFQPKVSPSFLVFPNQNVGLKSVFALMKAFNASKE